MGTHLINGEFQSDKYPTTPRGKVPLSVRDPTAQDLLWEYAQRRRAVDAEFSDDLETALRAAGYAPRATTADRNPRRHARSLWKRIKCRLGFHEGPFTIWPCFLVCSACQRRTAND